MKIISSNISPLPFYDDLRLQNHRKDYAYGQVFPLITFSNFLLPFQFTATITENEDWGELDNVITEVKLYNFNTSEVIDITNSMLENGLAVKTSSSFLLIKYPGILPVTEIKQEGRYYLGITVNNTELYSDVFVVSNNVNNYLKLEYYNSYNFELKNGVVDFTDNFKFKCYLDTQIGKPQYTFEEEATERMGYSFIESQVSKKTFKFAFVAPEYLCDALRLVRLCENKKITSKLKEYDLTTFIMEPKWEEQGDLAAIECEFETDTVVANVGGYTPVLRGGDFNSAYTNDFKNK